MARDSGVEMRTCRASRAARHVPRTMLYIALVSGGKDSVYSMVRCAQLGHVCCCMANLHPPPSSSSDECDSFTFQTVGCAAVQLVAGAARLPLIRAPLRGKCVRSTCEYEETQGDEVEDLLQLLQLCVQQFPAAQAVSCGAVLSDYQRLRVENVCRRLRLTCLAPLWRMPQQMLVDNMLADGVDAVIVKVAASGLPLSFLGRRLSDIRDELESLARLHGLHVAGEGGEYETICIDAPIFSSSLSLRSSVICQTVWDKYAPVAHLEQLVFESSPKNPQLDPIAQLASTSCSVNPTVDFSASAPLPVPFRSSPLKGQSSAHSSVVLCCRGNSADFMAHCNNTLADASKLLEEAGASWQNVSGVIVQLADIANFTLFNQCYARSVPLSSPPTRFSVCMTLEETALFIISIQLSKSSSRHMHVESISFWAPANIGPYSQSQLYPAQGDSCGNLLLVSGQIGLVPERMVIVSAESGQLQLEAECSQVLRNLAAVVTANGLNDFSSCVAVASVFSTGDNCAVEAAIQSAKINFAHNFPGIQLIAFGVGVSGLPRSASVEVSLQVLSPATLRPLQEANGVMIYRAFVSTEIQLIVAFVRDEEGVTGLKKAVASLGSLSNDADVVCTAWVTGSQLLQLSSTLEADCVHNWSVMPAHSLLGDISIGAVGSCSAILSIARHLEPT